MSESTTLIEQIANYKFSDMEKKLLATTATKRHWRLLPLVMAKYIMSKSTHIIFYTCISSLLHATITCKTYSIGRDIILRRKQQTEYNFIDFEKELERREAKDPEQARHTIKYALERMTKTSDALHKVN